SGLRRKEKLRCSIGSSKTGQLMDGPTAFFLQGLHCKLWSLVRRSGSNQCFDRFDEVLLG
ncbi:hypothetical protein PoB_002809000, partial [Plakobranchus ocellatus]